MILFLTIISCFFLQVLRLAILLINKFSSIHIKNETSATKLSVSVLIPARNEENTIITLLESLLNQDYEHFDILVLDDQSIDSTFEILSRYQEKYPTIKIYKGEELKEGWLGKNYACYQLSQKTQSDILLFLDADVILEKNAISSALHHLEKNKIALLSVFPTQYTVSRIEKIVVPLMHDILLGFLPLSLVRRVQFESIAAANGQFMMYRKKVYHKVQPHEACKAIVIEDIASIRLVKKSGFKADVLLGGNSIFCRMYRSKQEALSGFSKNLYAGFGKNIIVAFIYFLVIVSPFIGLLTISLAGYSVISFLIIIISWINHLLILKIAKYDVKSQFSIFLTQRIYWVRILLNSIKLSYQKQSEWKGRRLG